MKNILISTFKIITMQSYAQAVKLLAKVLITRILSVQSFGILSLILLWSSLLVPFLNFGTGRLITKVVSEKSRRDGYSKGLGVTIWSGLILTIITSIVLILIFLFPDKIETLLNVSFIHLFAILALAISMAIFRFQFSLLNGLSKPVLGRIPDHLLFPSLLILFLIYCYFVLPENMLSWIINGYVVIYVVSAIVGLLLMYYFFFRKYGKEKPDISDRKIWMSFATSNFLTLSSYTFLSKLDLMFIGLLMTANDVALYVIPSNIFITLTFITRTFNVVLEPKISYFYSTDNLSRLVPTLRSNIHLQVLVGIAIYAIVFFLGDLVLLLFGEAYVSVHDVLKVTCLAMIIQTIAGPSSVLLTMTGKVKERLNVHIFTLVVSAAFYPALILNFGLIGGAYVFLFSIILAKAGEVWMVYKTLNINLLKLTVSFAK